MAVLVAVLAGVCAGLVVTLLLLPRVVEYVEEVEIAAPVAEVHDAIRYQRALMRWSAWPSETGSQCRVEGEDGQVGARTVFLDRKGQRFGHQAVTALTPGASVSFKIESKGPPQAAAMTLFTVPLAAGQTKVLLHFRNDITPPFHGLLRAFGVVRWTRAMHRKDLDGLRRYCERRETYTGEPLDAAA